ncbi:MAG TPA: CaiB/BaiF CoA-transferase family protein, partial [Vitreimonas sp.]|nr:CaiB/BaiF CoA-transferase family protein [Vitreimonas sp.]
LARMGFDDDTLSRLNPSLVHLAISGYGPDGPDAGRPGYDFVLQAEAGLMSITGDADADGGHPTKVGVAISDVVTGMFGAVGVLAGLLGRRREPAATRATGPSDRGRGVRVDVSILESTLAVLVNQAQNAFVSGVAPARLGNAHPNIVPYETFATADGEIVVAAGSERQWQRLCELLDRPHLAGDPRFATNGARVEHRALLRPILADALATRTSAAWLAALAAADVPSGAINDVLAAFSTPQALARGMRLPLEHPQLGPVDQVAPAITLDSMRATIRSAPPLLGEHTDEVLAELGFTTSDVAGLRSSATV